MQVRNEFIGLHRLAVTLPGDLTSKQYQDPSTKISIANTSNSKVLPRMYKRRVIFLRRTPPTFSLIIIFLLLLLSLLFLLSGQLEDLSRENLELLKENRVNTLGRRIFVSTGGLAVRYSEEERYESSVMNDS